ncbi:hypothetical protein R1flu_024526 [Riccia fluitans]|uniref:Uncharacterized protein n=1 Tax=Riccia fluitans TaxID=41844 RepID=A0ABD1XV66_9MARC
MRKKSRVVEVTPPKGGGRQEPVEEEMIEEKSLIVFQRREILSKKAQRRPMLLRLVSPARDATNDLVPITMGGGPTVDRAFRQVAIT